MADILHRVGIKAPINKVYQALATRDGVANWWTNDTRGDSKVGATLTFHFATDGVERGSFEMEVMELQPNQRVLWRVVGGSATEWIGTKIGFELKQDGEYVIVLFTQQGWKQPVEFMHHCSTKWAIFLMSLKQLAETGKGLPHPYDTKIDNWN